MNINNQIAQLIFVPATTAPTLHLVNNQINEIDNDILLITRHDPLLLELTPKRTQINSLFH